MYVLVSIHVETPCCVVPVCDYLTAQFNKECEIILDEIKEEICTLGATIVDFYLDYDSREVLVDLAPDSVYSMLVLSNSWITEHIVYDTT